MPFLDVSFVTQDPMLADRFDVRRRLDVVGLNGRVSATPDQFYTGLIGVITLEEPVGTTNNLIRTEDSQSVNRRIFVAAKFQFIDASNGRQPDEITWDGEIYTVEKAVPYSRYGNGIYECIAQYRGPIPPLQ